MKRPLVFAVIFLIVGILVGQYQWVFGGIGLLFVCAIFGVVLWKKKWGMKFLLVFLAFFLLGFVRVQWEQNHTKTMVSGLLEEKSNVLVEGVVREKGEPREDGVTLILKSTSVVFSDGTHMEKPVLFKIWAKGKTDYFVGDKIAAKGKIQGFSTKPTPTGFVESRYYQTKGYDCKLVPEHIEEVGVKKDAFWLREKIRNRVEAVYDAVLPLEEGGILKAIVMGNQTDLSDEIQSLYHRSGISHILAVSGMHASFVVLMVFFLFQKGFGWNKRVCSCITIFIATGYLFFIGVRASIFRAIVMVLVGLLANIFYEREDCWTDLALAALCILLYEPLFLWDVGFQLSFGAVGGIFLGNQVMKSFEKVPAFVKNTIGLSFFAFLGSFPLVAYYFYEVSLVGIFLNVLVLPTMGTIMGVGILMGLVGQFSLGIANFFGGSIYVLLQFIKTISSWASSFSWSCITIGRPALWVIVAYYLGICTLCLVGKGNVKKGVIAVYASIMLVAFLGNRLPAKKDLITFLDVGQGDCTIVITGEKDAYVIDGGGEIYRSFGENTGHFTVAPYLRQQGISKVKGVFITHMDSDHAIGAIELLEEMPVEGVYISPSPMEPSTVTQQFLKTVAETKVPVYTIQSGDTAMLSSKTKITCLSPVSGDSFWDENANSLVLRLERGEREVLLMGDAGISAEMDILARGTEVSADVLKVGHHGSRYSTSEKWLQAVAPQYGILSYKKGNLYGHPHLEVVERLEQEGVSILDTDRQGTIEMKTDGKKWSIETAVEGGIP